ncbi:MAG TPA: acetyl-CoA carboxylase biotin carboxylase subunit [Planctomycetota bacterium]|nr:acetyl-CoA carboxylase biotin carboxylase subunit [Planctomycetota bacterium]
MFSRILVANRGEIALRIVRACKELGVETVAVYSEVDENALHLRYADEKICIGPGPSLKSYLDPQRIIAAAEIADVDAIHPGYGFLSENARFAEICKACKFTFIGPRPETIDAVGNKARARELAKKAGVPTVPGSEGLVQSDDEARRVAAEIGYPVMIKAAAGGGGRGMRVAHDETSLLAGFAAARAEAGKAFNDSSCYIEKFVVRPRHVEIQILADAHGDIVHLGERDCSVQRRHQKLIEESPSPALTPELRRKMGEAAVRFAKAGDYVNAGTVEFLLAPDGSFYFMEMNSRIQVEHPVTELVYGVDLVKEQIRIAAGAKLPFTQEQLTPRGHAIEVRVNAEDPEQGFRPCPGRVSSYVPPGGPGVRVDSHLFSGYVIPPHYDSLVAKVLAWRPTREEAMDTLLRALREMQVEGVRTTIPLFVNVLRHGEFRAGRVDTGYLDTYRDELFRF